VPKNVTRVKFRSTVTEVDDATFQHCRNLKEVVLNEGLRKIGASAFGNCKLLGSIRLPSTVTEVGKKAFGFCISLMHVVLNEGLQKIGIVAFHDCSSLERIKLPSTLTEVGNGTFLRCSNLRDVVLNEGLQTIGKKAFARCPLLESINFPSTVVEVGDEAFRYCDILRDVVLNEGIQKIGEQAFGYCDSLDNIKFPCISRRLQALSQSGQQAMENKINDITAVEWRGGEILISLESVAGGENWETTRETLDWVLGLIGYYELKEATAIFELALWKAMISVEAAGIDEHGACRIGVPGPVKAAVLQYFSYNRER
ncbi:hypothetical protein ACHAXR_002965, partial [Thalassiosira sp. AJA248-18]